MIRKMSYHFSNPILLGLVYSVVWWAVAWALKTHTPSIGWASITLFLGLFWWSFSSETRWSRVVIIALIGFISDLVHSKFGMMPPMNVSEALLVGGLWICFGRLLIHGVFDSIPYRWAPVIGSIGALINYQGLAAFLAFHPSQSLLWIALEWALLFPLFLLISRPNSSR